MMASTMAIPHIAALQNFHGGVHAPIPGTLPGNVPGAIPGGYPGHVPVTLHAPIMSAPVANGTNTPAATISPPVQTLRVPVVPVGGGCYNDGMEVVWHGEFSRLFSSFFPPHVWYLSITNSAPQEKWKFCRDSAKVRFCCQDCGNGWTSMKGRVTFWFHLNPAINEGFVQFKLYGQVCKKCNSGKFEYVMWYPEEVSKVMCNLYNKVGQTYYGFVQPPIRIDRRPGRPRNQHNSDLCQACRDGECDQGKPFKSMYNFIPQGVNGTANGPLPPRSQVPPQSLGQVIQQTMPVVISQPPQAQPPHIVMQPQMNPTSVPGPAVQTSGTGAPLITPPVTLTSGAQPILTYSIVTGPVNDAAKIVPTSEPFKPGSVVVTSSLSAIEDKLSQISLGQHSSSNINSIHSASVSVKSAMVNGISEKENVDKAEVHAPNKYPLQITSGADVPLKNPLGKDGLLHSPVKGETPQSRAPLTNGYATAAATNGKLPSQAKVV